MIPTAHIVHQVRGRVRLRISEKRQDLEYFEEVRRRLEPLSAVTEARISSTTGSILLIHPQTPYPELETQLRGLDLFEIVAGPEPEPPALSPVLSGLSSINRAISSGSAGRTDLRTLAFVGLMGLTLRQIMRGEIMAPALPLFGMALTLLNSLNSLNSLNGSDSGEGS